MAEGVIAVVAEARAEVMAEDIIQGMKRRKRRRLLTNHPFRATIVKSMAILPAGILTRRDREVVDFTRSCVKNNTELTNLGN